METKKLETFLQPSHLNTSAFHTSKWLCKYFHLLVLFSGQIEVTVCLSAETVGLKWASWANCQLAKNTDSFSQNPIKNRMVLPPTWKKKGNLFCSSCSWVHLVALPHSYFVLWFAAVMVLCKITKTLVKKGKNTGCKLLKSMWPL